MKPLAHRKASKVGANQWTRTQSGLFRLRRQGSRQMLAALQVSVQAGGYTGYSQVDSLGYIIGAIGGSSV